MKTIYGLEQLVLLGADMAPGYSQPCMLVAPELLRHARLSTAPRVRESAGENAITFKADGQQRDPGPLGIERRGTGPDGRPRYRPIADGRIACGVTRVSFGAFEQAREQVESEADEEGMPVAVAHGDLIELTVHRTAGGPGVVLAVQTDRILAEIATPRLALNPFGLDGWRYLECIFSAAAFFWAVTDGQRAFVLTSIQQFYPELVRLAHQRCLQFAGEAALRDWPRALDEIRGRLRA